jgi:proline iminopeptidase
VTAGLVRVNGTRLYVDDRGSEDAPALLYLHGGPGLGCHDFMTVQGDRLARSMRVIGVDQRGVLRSDGLPAATPLTVDLLIDDVEALRAHLGLDSWHVLGHSAGGCYALVYATRHPRAVDGAVFDCPCWDCDLTDRHRLPHAARLLSASGQHDAAARCRQLAAQQTRIQAADRTWEVMQALGDAYGSLFYAAPDAARRAEDILADADFSDEELSRGRSHEALMETLYRSHLHLLDALTAPTLLCRGRDDLVTSPDVVDHYSQRAAGGAVHTFQRSAHFAYLEEPDEYATVISSFVRACDRRARTAT